MPTQQLDTAMKGIEAYNRGDLGALLELVGDDVEFVVPDTMPNSGSYIGREGFQAMTAQGEEAWEEFRVEIVEMIEEGDAVIVSVHQYGRGRGSGIETQMWAAHLMRFDEGRLCAWRLCESAEEAMRQVRKL